jgi:putative addiction module killer protein
VIRVLRYLSPQGRDLFGDWFEGLADRTAKVAIARRVNRIEGGNFGDHKAVGEGVFELRIDIGPGYRVYFGRHGETIVLLLLGGDKRRQSADIERAKACWRDWKKEQTS